MRIAVLVKQVPRFEAMSLGPGGRLVREGVELELNPYCRRAVTTARDLARTTGGTSTVISLGPPTAEDCLREAIAWGCDDGVLITDPALAGSDTLATARALAAALRRLGPFDLVLCGRNSVDADTGQVGPAIAELLDLPFAGPARDLALEGGHMAISAERDDGHERVGLSLPAVVSCAERLTEPAKVDPAGRAAVDPARIARLSAADLGEGPWGEAGSPTRVGEVREMRVERRRMRLCGSVAEQARRAVDVLAERGALGVGSTVPVLPPPHRRSAPGSGPVVAVLLEPDLDEVTRELLGEAGRLTRHLDGSVVALGAPVNPGSAATMAAWGADTLVSGGLPSVAEDAAEMVAGWCAAQSPLPWAVLAPSTSWGREVAARVAARLGAGLTGDAVQLEVRAGRLVAWKPAFGGSLVAAIGCSADPQMVTVRPGVLRPAAPSAAAATTTAWPAAHRPRGRVVLGERVRDDDVETLTRAAVLVGVGAGVTPDDYPALQPLLGLLGAELAATRKVTDRGWLPRSRQVGITGRAVSPRLYIALAVAGKFNHVVGFRGAHTVLAINSDPNAPIFDHADIGMVAPWPEATAALIDALVARLAAV